jgi:GAF domain-containing protein
VSYGPLYQKDRIVRVVESVTDITEAVLEMPFLKAPLDHKEGKRSDRSRSALGLPPITVVSASKDPTMDRRVIAVNDAAVETLTKRKGKCRPKEEALGKSCVEAFLGREPGEFCESCPVPEVVNNRLPVKRLTKEPEGLMVTAVPLMGPDNEVRAVFQFLDDIHGLVKAEQAGCILNTLTEEEEIIRVGLSFLREVASARRGVLLELRDCDRRIIFRGEKEELKKEHLQMELETGSVPLAGKIIQEKKPVFIEDMGKEDELGPVLRKLLAMTGIGPGVLIPILTKDNELLGIASLVRERGERPFDFGDIIYCRPLADHFAGALARARILKQREEFIAAMKNTAGVLDPLRCLDVLLNSTATLLPEEISLTGYLVKRPPGHRQFPVVFAGGAGKYFLQEFEKCGPKWEIGQNIGEMDGDDPAAFSDFREQSYSVESFPIVGPLGIMSATRSIYIHPLVSKDGKELGLLMAQSPCDCVEKAFRSSDLQILRLISEFASILVGRYEILENCMLSFFGHDLQQPLYGAIEFLEEIEHTSLIGERDRHHTVLIRQCIKRILVGYKAWCVAAGAINALGTKRDVDIVQLTKSALESFRSSERLPAEEIHLDITTQEGKCTCAPDCIEICISELLSNALKFRSPEDPIRVWVETEKGEVSISFENRGSIPPDSVDRLGEPGYRAEKHVRDEIAGSGLGLWMVKILIENGHDGKVDIHNDSKRDTICFTIRLPLAQA